MHRALERLKDWGLIEVRRGVRATVTARETWPAAVVVEAVEASQPPPESVAAPEPVVAPEPVPEGAHQLLDFCLRRDDEVLWRYIAQADPTHGEELARILARAGRRTAGQNADVADYELDISRPGGKLITTFVDLSH